MIKSTIRMKNSSIPAELPVYIKMKLQTHLYELFWGRRAKIETEFKNLKG
jgi:hypothetical protein